jgi:SAM-dependent methyltransferase
MNVTSEAEVSHLMHSAHLQALEDEEVGVQHRIKYFYLPLFLKYSQKVGKTPTTMRIMDCGCGNGASVEYLAAAGFQSFGIDIAGFRAEQWVQRSKLPRVNLLAADATALPFPDCYFDIVLSCGMLEHIGVAEKCTPSYQVTPLSHQADLRERFLRESMRVLTVLGETCQRSASSATV